MHRNTWKILISCLLALVMLAACSGGENTGSEETGETTLHTHTALEGWEWNGTEHWNLCDCGEKVDSAAHNLGEDMLCVDCGVEIWDFDDGYVDAIGRNEYGDIVQWISYDPDGNVISESKHDRQYDDQGNLLHEKYYSDGILCDETDYAVGDDGEARIVRNTAYFEDGEYYVTEYDEYGDFTQSVLYSADGQILSASYYEYAIDSNGERYEARNTEVYTEGDKLVAEYNEYGDIICRAMYDADGALTREDVWEYEYNEDGDPMWQKQYTDGFLTYEVTSYIVCSDDSGYMRFPEILIDYEMDGSKLVSEYGSNGHVSRETYYLADGSVDYVFDYVYELDEAGNWSRVQTFENDRLVMDAEYALHEEWGWTYKARTTEYLEDGTFIVCEYDEYETLISETYFDADGNEVP